MSQTATTGTLAAFARHLGVHKSTITRAVQAGRIPVQPDGKINFAAATAAWHQTSGSRTDVSARHAENRGAEIPEAGQAQKTAQNAQNAQSTPDTDINPTPGDRTQAKAAILHYENSLIKLEMALRRGIRYERRAVIAEATSLGHTLRSGIERLIDQTAPRLAAATHDSDRRRILQGELDRLRRTLRRELPRSLRRMRDAGRKVGADGTAHGE